MSLNDDIEADYVDIATATAESNKPLFEQHDDADVIIPDKIARPLVYSATLLFVNAIVAISFLNYGLFAVLMFVYITSLFHWSKPRFSAIARRVDYFAVFVAVLYGSIYAIVIIKKLKYLLMWFIGLSVISVIFICNESSYYYQVMKLPSGNSIIDTKGNKTTLGLGNSTSPSVNNDSETVEDKQKSNVCIDIGDYLPVTYPNTMERERVYKRTVYVHLLCIHVFANALAFVLIIQAS